MTVPQILLIGCLVVVTAVLAWWLGRRSAPAKTPALEARPTESGDPESRLHAKLAQAAADMVVPLETYFARGVELNLTTASLTKELLAQLPAPEAQAVLALQAGLDGAGLEQLSQTTGLSLSELESLRQKFHRTAAAALLPKIKAGLSSSPDRRPKSPQVDTAKPSLLTERLTLSTVSEEVTGLKQQLQEARETHEQFLRTHVPKTQLDSQRDETLQHRQAQTQLAQTIESLQAELTAARAEITAPPVDELKDLREQLSQQESLAGELEKTIQELQASLGSAAEASKIQDELEALQKRFAEHQESHVPRSVHAQEKEQQQEAHEALLHAAERELKELREHRASVENQLTEFRSTHFPKTEQESLQALLSEEQGRMREVSFQCEALKSELQALQDSHVPASELDEFGKRLSQQTQEHAAALAVVEEQLAAARTQSAELETALEAALVAGHRAESLQVDLAEEQRRREEGSLQHAALQEALAAIQESHVPRTDLEEIKQQFSQQSDEQALALAALQDRSEALERSLEEARAAEGAAQEKCGELSVQLAAALEASVVPAQSETQEELAVELKIAREAQTRLVAELEALREAHAAIPEDHHLASVQLTAVQEEKAKVQSALEAMQQQRQALEAELVALRQGSVARGDYEALRTETDKARGDLSTALSRYATLQRRFEAVDKAASIERLKAHLTQEEKAHGVLRIQYRNLESRLYEAVGARKRVETDLKAITKTRDELAAKLKAIEKAPATRVKVILPPEIANPTLEEGAAELTEEPAPKRRASKKKLEEPVAEVSDAVEATPPVEE